MNTGHNFKNIRDFDENKSEHKVCHNYYTRRDTENTLYPNNITPISLIENEPYFSNNYLPMKVTEYKDTPYKNSDIDKYGKLHTPIEDIEKNSYNRKFSEYYDKYQYYDYPNYSIYNKNSHYDSKLNFEKYENITKIPNKKLILDVKKDNFKNNSHPHVFGPPLWFILHISSMNYPDNPSTVVRKNMEYIIKGLPVLIPCQNCKEHATAHIEKHIDKIPEIVSSKDNIFKFFVDFHNYVNERHNKPIVSYEEAYKLYSGNIENKFTYN